MNSENKGQAAAPHESKGSLLPLFLPTLTFGPPISRQETVAP